MLLQTFFLVGLVRIRGLGRLLIFLPCNLEKPNIYNVLCSIFFIMIFDFMVPTRIYFGRGMVSKFGDLAGEYGNSALVVTGRCAMRRHGYLEKVLGDLGRKGIKYEVFDGVS